MSKLLNRINEDFKRKETKAVPTAVEESNSSSPSDNLQLYRSLLESEATIELKFVGVDEQGTQIALDNAGVNLKMLKEDMRLNSYQRRAGSMLGHNLSVAVKEIDEEANTVYFKMSSRKSTIADTVNKEIANDLRRNRPVNLDGRIVKVFPSKGNNPGNAWVRLMDLDVIGNIDVREWAPSYTPRIEEAAIVGEIYNFDVIGKFSTNRRTGKPIWHLSRKNIAPDPWNSIPVEFKEGNIMLIKAVDKPKGKTYFWGTSPLVPGINIMCNYPSNVQIVVGAYYSSKIDRLDINDKFFRVSPFAVVPVSSVDAIDPKELAKKIAKTENGTA